MPNPKQDENLFEPEYESYAGVKHEFTGTLFIPTADEEKRIEQEQAARATSPVDKGEQMLFVPTSMIPHARPKVRMKMTDALRMRQRG